MSNKDTVFGIAYLVCKFIAVFSLTELGYGFAALALSTIGTVIFLIWIFDGEK